MILISAYSRQLESKQPNPKNYPWWPQLIRMLDLPVTQVAVSGDSPLVSDVRWNLPLDELAQLVTQCEFWISCDSFFQHFAWDLNKPGVVLWGPSNPAIFGHKENINIVGGSQHFVKDQFLMWSMHEYQADRFASAACVAQIISQHWPHAVNTSLLNS
jgi:ADP-heptose:LPS heptosyltransferase